ncbi:hypothetical protein HRG84_24205 [Flavisolibacter sp. BT320]|nr:hypothetical protein [Flavisolibacter longurius]
MKTFFLCAAMLFTFKVYSQDTVKLKQIDSLVNLINNSGFKVKRDTVKQDNPVMGFSARNYLTTISNGKELLKYSNDSHFIAQQNGSSEKSFSNNTFYFHHNKLIKVEEFTTKEGKKMDAHWYYADDKPVYYTFKSDRSQARAELLLVMAKSMMEKMGFK